MSYLGVKGPKTVFGSDKPLSFTQITDGTSNTILLVEVNADQAIPWAKPGDLELDPENSKKGMAKANNQGILAGFADGHAQIIPKSIEPKVLEALFTFFGGESIDAGDLQAP